MHSCLSVDHILHEIISKLNLQEKFGVQGVCQRWKNIAIECLRHHEYLAMNEDPSRSYSYSYYSKCDEHASLMPAKNNNLIKGKWTDLEFWKRTLSLLQGVKYIHMSLKTDESEYSSFQNYRPILQLLIGFYGQSLECLCIPKYSDYSDKTFPQTHSLPRLKHLVLRNTTPQVTKNILSACPNIEYLASFTSFQKWQMLPKGFKKLRDNSNGIYNSTILGISNLLSSPAVESLEVVETILITSEICYQSYHLSCLKRFEVMMDYDVTNCLTHLARILSFAPVLCELKITIKGFAKIHSDVWINVLSECPTLTKLTIRLLKNFDGGPLINVSLFQDDFAKTIVSKIKRLKYLDIGFHLSSDGLRLLSELDNLEHFRHSVYVTHKPYDRVFDTDALIHFLSTSFGKKLTEYHFQTGYLILNKSFLNFIKKMETEHSITYTKRSENDILVSYLSVREKKRTH